MELLSIREAATRLGVTPQTVRRKRERGELSAEWIQGKFGGEWRVALEDEPPTPLHAAPAKRSRDLARIVEQQAEIIGRLTVRLFYLGDCMMTCPIGMKCVSQPMLREVKRPVYASCDPQADIYGI